VRNRLRRPPEQDAGSHCGGQGDGEPCEVGQFRFCVLAADTHIAEFGEPCPYADYHNKQSQNTGRPAQIRDDPVVDIVDDAEENVLADQAQHHKGQQDEERREKGHGTQLHILLFAFHINSPLSF